MIGLYSVQSVGIAFLAVLMIVAIVYYASRKSGPVRAGKEKETIFACGEDERPEDLNVVESGFFTAFGRGLGISRLRNWHNGDLSNYLTWIFIGLLLLIMVMVIYW